MSERTISASTFGQLCANGCKADEAQDTGLDHLSFEMCPEVPILLRIKNLLAQHFEIDDECDIKPNDDETRSQTLIRTIAEILDNRMEPDFQYGATLNMYIERAAI